MTWQDLVEEVERQMKEKGIPADTDIWYIDISLPDEVKVFKDGAWMVVQ